ncbi:MAG: DUF5680 domain-containing protein [Candidatus Levyibacteriota bacterium]
MDTDKLRTFLLKANKEGYASGDNTISRGEDFSYVTNFEDGDVRLNDSWFGGEPFGGREVVFYKGKPYWMMVYYGSDSGKAEGLIPFLRKALIQPEEEMPIRGPRKLEEGDFSYENSYRGDVQDFVGEEKIFYKGEEVFKTNYSGGLVNQRRDQV